MTQWPVADLDDVRRMQVLAASLPGGAYAEIRLDVPFERVWGYLADVEHSIPALIGFLRAFEVEPEHGEQFTARAVGVLGNRGRMDVVLRDGWCLMQDRFVVGGFAAVPDGTGTLVATCGAGRIPVLRRLAPLVFGGRSARRILEKLCRNVG